jgi:hypothetical protein
MECSVSWPDDHLEALTSPLANFVGGEECPTLIPSYELDPRGPGSASMVCLFASVIIILCHRHELAHPPAKTMGQLLQRTIKRLLRLLAHVSTPGLQRLILIAVLFLVLFLPDKVPARGSALGLALCENIGKECHHLSTKWTTKLSTIGPCKLRDTSDQPILELLVRSTVDGLG